jgi:TonB family protein
MKLLNFFLGISLFLVLVGHHSVSRGQTTSKSPTTGTSENLYKGSEVAIKASVTKKPEPKYTKAARKNQVTGTVVIRCVFSKTGEVTNIHVVSGLPDGLTDRAVEAARKIKFIPATKDGHPVSMWMELQYNFNLH